MTKKPLIIIPAILIVHSAVIALYTLHFGPSRYYNQGSMGIWLSVPYPFIMVYFALKVKATFWGASIIMLGFSQASGHFIHTFPTYMSLIVVVTLIVDAASAAALVAASRYDSFDLSMFENRSRSHYWLKLAIALAIIVGIFWYGSVGGR